MNDPNRHPPTEGTSDGKRGKQEDAVRKIVAGMLLIIAAIASLFALDSRTELDFFHSAFVAAATWTIASKVW